MLRFNCTQHVSLAFFLFVHTQRQYAMHLSMLDTITIVGHTFSSFPASPLRDTELWTVLARPLWRFDGCFHAAGDSSRRSRCKCAWFCLSRSLLAALLTLTLTLTLPMLLFLLHLLLLLLETWIGVELHRLCANVICSLSPPLLPILIYLHIRVRLRSRATFEINRNLSPQPVDRGGASKKARVKFAISTKCAFNDDNRERASERVVWESRAGRVGNVSQLTQGDTCVNICAAIFCWLLFWLNNFVFASVSFFV